ncbi:MAG: hypothetical protein N3B21_07200 [Clostridia bacterium]|nr:hypothetical protein [Clostridia bacterium]
MKVLRGLLAFFLILVIVGGLGYIVWSMFLMPGMNHPGANTPQGTAPHQQTPNTQHITPSAGTPDNKAALNVIAVQNKDKLSQAITTINQALDLITIDPYSKTTVSSIMNGSIGGQAAQGTGAINIYPSGNSSVNISPGGNNPPNNQAPAANNNQGGANQQQNINFVFDQGKLQQIHTGIFSTAQGIMMINQLNDDLAGQAATVEATPAGYQTYITRYNTALQNKAKLSNAINMLSQASTLVNVNPYGSPNGYQYNTQSMQQMHQGVYKLAQGMTMLSRLNDDFTSQMVQASQQAQSVAGGSSTGHGTKHGTMVGLDFLGSLDLTTVFNVVLVIMVIGLIIGIFGAILSMLRPKHSRNRPEGNPEA